MEGTISSILMIVVMIAIFYFMLIRPENKRKKEANEMRDSLAVGDEITTIGGIVGTICAVKPNSVVLETGAHRVRIALMKCAVSTKGVQVSEDGKGEVADNK
jgi:preprotein translocase subunit YajC